MTIKCSDKELKSDIKQFSRTSSLEEIARNNLKMAGQDEVLVLINNTNKPDLKDKKHKLIKKSEQKTEQRSANAG